LKNDPMLKPVHDKWSGFERCVLDEVFKYGKLHLQIRWEGWFVRPVLEMTSAEFSTLLREASGENGEIETIMFSYGGTGGTMGQVGSFDTPKEWFGFKKEVLESARSRSPKDIFQELMFESNQMKSACVQTFPVPTFKSDGTNLPEGAVLDEIQRLDAAMVEPNKPDKTPRIKELMEPSTSNTFESQGGQYYFYGPFNSRDELIGSLKNDPMLKPVHDKWSKFERCVLDEVFKYGTLYLQIRWEGWFVRPVLEMTQEGLSSLVIEAIASVVAMDV